MTETTLSTISQPYLNQDHLNALFVKSQGKTIFLGSCFYFTDNGRVLVCTAEHCVRGVEGDFVVVSKGKEYPAELVHKNKEYDVALLSPLRTPAKISMTLSAERQKAGNIQLLTYEYSTTAVKENKFVLIPATRLGNCVRVIQLEETFGIAGKDMLELSFPALKGASGAAVVELSGNVMIAHGMIVANSEHHLLPAHIETVVDEKDSIHEERKYFLPQAIAVNSIRIIEVLKSLS